MISTSKKWTTLLLLLLAGSLTAQVKLPPIFSSNMVLQQGIEIPVWGWASPDERVTVTIEKAAVGLINTSWGGTIAETWISNETISKNPDFDKQMAQLKKIDLDDYARTDQWKGITE